MAEIILPDKWRSQPPGIARIAGGNWFANDLKVAIVPSAGLVNLVDQGIGNAQPTTAITATGKAHLPSASVAYSLPNEALDSSKPLSGFVLLRPLLGYDGFNVAGNRGGGGSGGFGWVLTGTADFILQNLVYWGVVNQAATTTFNGYRGSFGNLSSMGFSITPATTGGSRFFGQGEKVGASVNSGTPAASSVNLGIYQRGDGSGLLTNVHVEALFLWNRNLSDEEHREIHRNPWQLLRKPGRIYFLPSAGGGGATGTGALSAQSSTVAGTATRTVTGTGTPSAQASAVAGTAEREITSSGTPSAQSSTVSGSGSVSAGISGSGTLSAQSSTVAGTATRTVTASGSPAAQSAAVAGTAEREITGTGTPAAQASTVAGTGQVGNIITGSGTPAAQSATVAGTAERTVTGSGSPAAQASTVAGTGVRTITGGGAVAANDSTVYGYDTAPVPSGDTGGGGSRRVLIRERKVREEVDEWLAKNAEKELLKKIQREDEEIVLIMALVA